MHSCTVHQYKPYQPHCAAYGCRQKELVAKIRYQRSVLYYKLNQLGRLCIADQCKSPGCRFCDVCRSYVERTKTGSAVGRAILFLTMGGYRWILQWYR